MTPQPTRAGANVLERAGAAAFGAVSHAIQGKYTHSGIYVGKGNVIDIRAETGVRKVPLKSLTQNLSVAAVRPTVSRAARARAVEKAHSYLANKDQIHYDIKGLVPAALSGAVKFKPRPIDEQNVICSSMVANMYDKDPVAGEARHVVKPVDFLKSDKVRAVGAYDVKHSALTPGAIRAVGGTAGALLGAGTAAAYAPEDHLASSITGGAVLGGALGLGGAHALNNFRSANAASSAAAQVQEAASARRAASQAQAAAKSQEAQAAAIAKMKAEVEANRPSRLALLDAQIRDKNHVFEL